MKVLITCPPMLGLADEFLPIFASNGIEVTTPTFTQTMTEDELIQLVPHHHGWIIGDDPATEAVFRAGAAGRLTSAVKWGVGVDNVDFNGAAKSGVSVTNTPDMFGDEVADLAHSYIVSLARDTYQIDRGVRAGDWPKPAGISLRGKTVGIVGLGDVGRAVISRVSAAGMKVIGYDPDHKASQKIPDASHVNILSWPEGLEELDFLVLCCSLNSSNHHLVNAAALARCKDGIRIVNVARGPLIDEQALSEGLVTGRVHSAALDVFEIEPLPASSQLRDFPQLIFGSHNASNTKDAVIRTSLTAIDKLFGFLNLG